MHCGALLETVTATSVTLCYWPRYEKNNELHLFAIKLEKKETSLRVRRRRLRVPRFASLLAQGFVESLNT
jgi:hypothetical protein